MISKLWSAEEPNPKKRPRQGGWRQQLQRQRLAEASSPQPSQLAMGHLLDWADGVTSAKKMARHMANAKADGTNIPMVLRLANIGAGGPQHASHNLFGLLEWCGIPSQLTALRDSNTTDILLPSTLIRLLHSTYPAHFKRLLGADQGLLNRFWGQLLERPQNRGWMQEHPVLRGLGMEELGFMIPLAVHEDAAPYSKTASFNCKSWSALLGDGDEKVTKYMACSCIKEKATAQADCSWEALLADLWALGSGTVDGQPVALEPDGTKWTFVLLIAKGDEECHCQEWGLPHYNSEEVCSECLANRTDHPYTDLRRGASWRLTTPLGKAAYLARCRQPLHPLLAHPMATRLLCFLDVMHMVDCKGVASWVFGGVLNTLLKEPALGANQKERLRRINQERLQWYKNNPGIIKLPRLLLHSHRQQDGWAELAGPAFKAAVTRNAARFFEHLAASFCNSDTPKHQNIRKVTSNLVGFYGVLYKAGWFLNKEELVKLATHTQDFGVAYQRLRNIAAAEGELAWPIRPKAHKMMHIPELAGHINPIRVQCYSEESLMGTTARVYKKSMFGRYKATVQKVVLCKRLTGLLLRLEGAVS